MAHFRRGWSPNLLTYKNIREITTVRGRAAELALKLLLIGWFCGRCWFRNSRKGLMRSTKGFSLVELLIVVAIILIIAAIAIPNLLHARISANEASAVGSISAIKSSEVTYSSGYPTVGYSPNIGSLGGAVPCTPA